MLPSQELEGRIARGALHADPAQQALALRFDTLLAGLLAYKQDTRPKQWLGFGKNKTKAKHRQQGLYIWGGVGRGKSMLMDSFFHLATNHHHLRLTRFHFHDFMRSLHALVHKKRSTSKSDPTQGVMHTLTQGAVALCFDEMEVRDIADAMIIARAMTDYIHEGGILVVTSNRHPDDLYKHGLQRERFVPFINALKSHCVVVEMEGVEDWRMQALGKGKEAGWYHPLTHASRDSLLAAKNTLACGLPATTAAIDLGGRALKVPWVAGGVAAMGFDALCRVPLAAADYLVLAERFSGLLLADIPHMDDSTQNEARRFMWLIDALYDRKRFLWATAEAGIEEIYTGAMWRAEFPRTRSRIHEMTRFHAQTPKAKA
ncbi:MAG: AFG1 family ATPase [Proteobacteria bacterium]|nr:AFG1 family ATPase [Pseudomonadota bacterium]